MRFAKLRFYSKLNDFLPAKRRQVCFGHQIRSQVSIKDMIESLGVPHTEIDLLLVNGISKDYSYQVRAGDYISVYPSFETLDIASFSRVRQEPPPEPCFVLDTHLGKLAAYLRMLGFDALYRNNYDDKKLAHISSGEKRILLTRDRELLKRSEIVYGYWVRTTNPRKQLLELLERYDLFSAASPFQRCMRCNGLLEVVSKEEIINQLSLTTQLYYDEYHRCLSCYHIYWKGSHFHRMQKFVDEILGKHTTSIHKNLSTN